MKKINPTIKLQQTLSKQIYDTLQGAVLERILEEARTSDSDNYWRNSMEGHSFKVEKSLLPHLHEMFCEVKEKLGYKEEVDFYITGDSSVNAFSVAAETKDGHHIVNVNSALVELMSDDELRFVIGHELGHLIDEDTRLRRLIYFVFPAGASVPTALYHKIRLEEQLAELVADRYGYLAVGKLEPCVSAFFKMASGLDISKMNIKLEALLEENLKHLDYFLSDKGVSTETHPVNPIRVQSLNIFANAKNQKSLDNDMEPLIQILLRVGSSALDKAVSEFVATAGLIVASVDEQIAQEEVDAIINSLADTQMFPNAFLDEISKKSDVSDIFVKSIETIFKENPMLREPMFDYIISLVLADKRVDSKEIDLLYQLGEDFFSYSRKEVAAMLAETVQARFIPDLRSLG